jgi:hypothetical protein
LDAGKQMIEKLPFWENPDLEIDKKELIKSELLAEFTLLLNFPHNVGSHYAFSFQGNLTSDTYTYTFSDGRVRSFVYRTCAKDRQTCKRSLLADCKPMWSCSQY